MKKKILSVSIPIEVREAIVADAKANHKSLDLLLEVILRTFLAMKVIERRLVYKNVPDKKFGRPL